MRFTPTLPPRRGHALPPAAPLPAGLQTLACRVRPLEYLEWCRSRIGPRFTVYPIDMPPLVFLSEPNDIRAVLTAPLTVLHAGVGAAITAPLFGERSFLLLEEEEYMAGRNAILPAFHRSVVRTYADSVAAMAEREVSSWPLDTAIQSHSRLARLTLMVMLRLVFGGEHPLLKTLGDRLLGMLSVTTSLVLQEPRLRHLPGWRATWGVFVRQRQEVDMVIAELIAEHRRTAPSDRHARDMLDMLLEATRPDGSPMSDGELRDNLVSVIIAGHETTASTLAWAFQLIAHHQSVQDRLLAEIEEGESDEYLTATISEVLRHRPVFLFAAPRAVAEPIEISGWTYYPPAHLLACTYLMHHDPALFSEPQEFRPDRFLRSQAPTHPWLPWGGGRKLCPGRHLALLELRAVLRATLSVRRLLPASGKIERARWRSALLTPHSGSEVVLRKHLASRGARLTGGRGHATGHSCST
jgi:cytochrome P450